MIPLLVMFEREGETKDFDLVYRREIDRMVPEVGQLGPTQHRGEDV